MNRLRAQIDELIRVTDAVWVQAALAVGCAAALCTLILFARAPFDFTIFLQAGHAMLHGHSPYASHETVARLGGDQEWVYPAFAALLFAPFSVLPYTVATLLFYGFGICLVLGSLRVLGVRDLRIYSLVLILPWVMNSLMIGAIDPLLLLMAALMWRYRERVWVPALALAVAISLKLFVAPLALLFLMWRKPQACAVCAVASTIFTLGAWALIGFHGLAQYPHVLSMLAQAQGHKGIGLYAAIAEPFGARAASYVCTAALVASIVWAWRLSRCADVSQLAPFTVLLAATTVLSPVMWAHYLVLLLIPVAVVEQRFDAFWIAFLVIGDGVLLAPGDYWVNQFGGVETVFVLAFVAVVLRYHERRVRAHSVQPGADLQLPAAA